MITYTIVGLDRQLDGWHPRLIYTDPDRPEWRAVPEGPRIVQDERPTDAQVRELADRLLSVYENEKINEATPQPEPLPDIEKTTNDALTLANNATVEFSAALKSKASAEQLAGLINATDGYKIEVVE